MKRLLSIILLVILNSFINSAKNCEDISSGYGGEKCFLSSEDKSSYDYCCYYGSPDYKCKPLTQEQYNQEKIKTPSIACHGKDEEPGCEDIDPAKASDCVKSSKDKGKYCCYEYLEISKSASCNLYDDDTEIEVAKALWDEFICPGYDDSKLMNIPKILLLGLMLILNLSILEY